MALPSVLYTLFLPTNRPKGWNKNVDTYARNVCYRSPFIYVNILSPYLFTVIYALCTWECWKVMQFLLLLRNEKAETDETKCDWKVHSFCICAESFITFASLVAKLFEKTWQPVMGLRHSSNAGRLTCLVWLNSALLSDVWKLRRLSRSVFIPQWKVFMETRILTSAWSIFCRNVSLNHAKTNIAVD